MVLCSGYFCKTSWDPPVRSVSILYFSLYAKYTPVALYLPAPPACCQTLAPLAARSWRRRPLDLGVVCSGRRPPDLDAGLQLRSTSGPLPARVAAAGLGWELVAGGGEGAVEKGRRRRGDDWQRRWAGGGGEGEMGSTAGQR
jgi:hypothetical protein